MLLIIIAVLTAKIRFYIVIRNNKIKTMFKVYIFKYLLIYKAFGDKNSKDSKRLRKIFKNKKINIKSIFKSVQNLKLKLDQFKLKVDICTVDPQLTAYIVSVISTIISILLNNVISELNYKNYRYQINPIYENKKIFNIKFNCIITINSVHIITIICKNFIEWRREKNGRKSSYRRANANCNE